jgi:hypothetical protein
MGNLRPVCHYLQTSTSGPGAPRGNTLALTRSNKLGLHGPENLFAYVEPADGSGTAAYAAEIAAKAIREAYAKTGESSATGLLRRMVQSANSALWHWNSKQSPRDRRYAGLTCALVRGTKLYLIQIGAGQVFYCNHDQLVALPPRAISKRLKSLRNSTQPESLGLLPEIEVECQSLEVANGDLLLLGPSDLGILVRPSDVQRGLFGPKTADVIDFLRRRSSEYGVDLEGCLVIRLEGGERAADAFPGKVAASAVSSAAGLVSNVTGAVKRKPRKSITVEPEPAAEEKAPARPRRTSQTKDPAPNPASSQRRRAAATTSRSGPVEPSHTRLGGNTFEEVVGTVNGRQRSRRKARANDSALRTALMLIGVFMAGMAARLLPDTAYEWLMKSSRRADSGRWVVTAAAVTIAAVIVIVWSISYISDRRTNGEIQALSGKVDRILAAAAIVKSDDDLRLMLDAALKQIDEASDSAAKSPAIVARHDSVQAQLDKVNHVVRLGSVEPLLDVHSKINGPSRLDEVVVGSGVAYLLDSGAGSIYAYNLASHGFERIMGQDWVVDGQQVGMIQQVGWRTGGLFFLDANNDVYLFNPDEHSWHRFRLQRADDWGSTREVVSFDGNMYVMSAADNQVWKYESGNLGSAPEPWLAAGPDVDLGKVRRMAVDGRIYLLMADGNISKFKSGRLEEKMALDVHPELLSPVDMSTTPTGSCLYIVDSYNRRIVVMSKDGKQQWQLLPPDKSTLFDDIRSVYVDDALRTMWIASGSKLLQVALPAEIPAPPASAQ